MSGGVITALPTWVRVCYLVAAICFILALKGLSSPKYARRGNLLAAAGMLLAVVVTFVHDVHHHRVVIVIAMLVGAAVAVPVARGVKMTAIPQLVAAFNGVGGGAAAAVAVTEFLHRTGGPGAGPSSGDLLATVATIAIGAVSFTGSAVTFGKLQELMTTRPVVFPGLKYASAGGVIAVVVLAVAVLPTSSAVLVLALTVVSLAYGVVFVLPVGGADVPIVISLLNAFTGLAVAASGYVLGNTLLLIAGTLVGASGSLLTRLMAQAMGRPVTGILFGAFTATAPGAAGDTEQRPVRTATVEDVAILLKYAGKVMVVPGYGLAVAQAQHTVREMADVLTAGGCHVGYAIHPVAGRMPGHMNVLLAEADVPYEQLLEMDAANGEFGSTDVALVVGANDVVNPAARDQPGSPIYGMPILDVDKSTSVIFLKRSMRPGFAGITNELMYADNTTLLFGDAKDSLTKLVTRLKDM